MSDKRSPANKQQPAHTIQSGAVVAAIHLRQSNCGMQYYDYVLTRTWKSLASGKRAHGTSFFESNQRDLVEAIEKASAWIRERLGTQPSDTSSNGTPDQPQQESR